MICWSRCSAHTIFRLAKFHVSPRDSLRDILESESRRVGKSLTFVSLYRGYAVYSVLTKP